MADTAALVALYPTAKLAVTGHSLGGSIATLAAVDIQTKIKAVDIIYTFGSPRTGNLNFSQFFKKLFPQSFRVVHNKDIVPHVPNKVLGYWHVPAEVWLDADSNLTAVCGSDDENCSMSVALTDCSSSDHLSYYQIYTGCDSTGEEIVQ
jgi:pimeloyl-ACP methyl ester carboxylesterase